MAAKKTATKKTASKTAPKKGKGEEKNLLKSVLITAPAAAAPTKSEEPVVEAPVKTPEFAAKTVAVKDQAIRAMANTMNSKDRQLLVLADEAPNAYMYRRPTGIMELDIDLAGGFPAGGMCVISGPDNCGKTWLMLKTMAMQQRLLGQACRLAMAVTEGAFPYDQAINAGMKIPVPNEILEQWQQYRRDRGMPLYTKDEIKVFKQKVGDVYLIRGAHGEETCEGLIEAVRSNAFSIVACDSMNGLMPMADLKKEMTEEQKRSAHANMMKKFFIQYIPITTNFSGGLNTTSLLFTRQVRSNQERANMPSYMQAYIPEWAPAGGGWASNHYKLIELMMWDSKVIKKEDSSGDKSAIGKQLNWKLEKGKAGTHDNKTGEMNFYYALGGVDAVGELIVSGIRRGVIQQRGQEMVVVRPDTKELLPGFTAPSPQILRRMIDIDIDFELSLRREILAAANIQCLYL